MSIFGKDTPVGRPDTDGRAGVFVPLAAAAEEVVATIRKGAGIVGFGNPDGTLTLYFEANRFDESNLGKWEQKCRKAYDRMVKQAPTVNKMTLDAENVEQIGYINGSGITIKKMDDLKRWLAFSNALDTGPQTDVVVWER